MQRNPAFNKVLYCLLRLKQSTEIEMHNGLENSICDPLKSTIGSLIFIVSIYMGKIIRIQRVYAEFIDYHVNLRPFGPATKKNSSD